MRQNSLLITLIALALVNLSPSYGETGIGLETIKRAITWVQPKLDAGKVGLYAKAIHRAASKYQVDPLTLIAIAHQESSFRENLPMGKAGELGLLQIRRQWIQNAQFRKEFRHAREQDLKNPEKAFVYAAWILHDLKRSSRSQKLPYWTFYNARKFENRLKYYLRVKRHLAAIEAKQERTKLVAVAAKRVISESPRVIAPQVQPKELLNQINWYQKALDLFQERES